MTTTDNRTVTLKPCRECGAPCRIEAFGGGVHCTPWDGYVCSNDGLFGGTCTAKLVYVSAETWNARPEPSPLPDGLDGLLLHELRELNRAQFDKITRLEADNAAKAVALIHTAASLAAAISLLEKGGKAAKKAAPSDKMFDQMLADYRRALEQARAALHSQGQTIDG